MDAKLPGAGFSSTTDLVALIPLNKGLAGPVTLARWRRALAVYAALFVLGLVLAWGSHPQWASFGLGLIFPGGGFLFHASGGLGSVALHLVLFFGTVFLFLLSLFLWAATGNLIAPILLWLGTAVAAGLMEHWVAGADFVSVAAMCRSGVGTVATHWADARIGLPLATLLLIAWAASSICRRKPWLAQERKRINAFLAHPRSDYRSPVEAATGHPAVTPLPEDDLALMRFLLDRALQPVEEFNGFDRIDEFREAAKRYQICNMSYMLSMYAYTRTPAFRGYLAEAQNRLSLKMMDHRIWKYWQLENLWGNLDRNPDPFARDNIMYYGWYGAMLGLNLCNTGDERFNRPGAIRLQHPSGRVYTSSFAEICDITRRNMQASDFCLFPCEPRWIYPMCNNFGALSLRCHDRVYGTKMWEEMRGRYEQSLEDEFVTMNGRITAIRDYYTGMTIPALTATMADAVTALFIHPLLPQIARRSWEIIRHDLIRVADGRVTMHTNGWDKIDFGNYRRSLISTYGLVAASAREMGDDEVADGLLDLLDSEFPSQVVGGVRHYAGGSVGAHTVIFAARMLRANGFHDLVTKSRPEAWKNGPLLQHAEYPSVMVAGAVSDGQALHLTLAPGAGGGRFPLGLSQLVPNRSYRVQGASDLTFRADGLGEATVRVELDRLTSLRIVPVH